LSLTRLRQHGDFLAPPDMHSKIKDSLEALTQIEELTFEIKSSPFEVLITKEPECLDSLVKSKCYLEKKIQTYRRHISVPKAKAANLEDLAQQSDSASATDSTSIKVGNSTINIAIGDLTTQAVSSLLISPLDPMYTDTLLTICLNFKEFSSLILVIFISKQVDVIVVCSTSDILRQKIIAAAGPHVQAAYDAAKSNSHGICATSNGALPCKIILFIPWKADSSDLSTLKPSLNRFISSAIEFGIQRSCTTLGLFLTIVSNSIHDLFIYFQHFQLLVVEN
jgi:hypothetical protein